MITGFDHGDFVRKGNILLSGRGWYHLLVDGVVQVAPALLILAWDFHVSLFLST